MAESITNVRLQELLPVCLKGDARVKAAALALNGVLQNSAKASEACLLLPRLDELPETVLDLLAWQWHVDFYEPLGLTPQRKRSLIQQSIAWHRQKGTPAAVREVVEAAYGNCELQEWYEYGGEPYFFRVAVTLEAENTDKNRWKNVITSINAAKNIRSWLEDVLYYYPIIHLPVKTGCYGRAAQVVETPHNVWNLGGARAARWDGEFNLAGAIRLEGIVPGEGYKERQSYKAGICFKVEAAQRNYALTNILDGTFCWDSGHNLSGVHMARLPILQAGLYMSIDARCKVNLAMQQAVIEADIKSSQRANLSSTIHSGQTIKSRHTNDNRMMNILDGGFCLDGNHILDGARLMNGRINHCCTIEINERMENI